MASRCVVVGRFDGVHLGHRHLLSEARRLSHNLNLVLTAYTFPLRSPGLLTLEARRRLLAELAQDIVLADWERVQHLEAEEFVHEELVGTLEARAVVVGPDHRFGRGRSGDPALLRELGRKLGFVVEVVEPLVLEGEAVSAGRIRQLVLAGEVERASRLLGRPPWLVGTPVRGAGLARKLGFPTVNLALSPELVRPRAGVYAAWALSAEGGGPALFYLGQRPTFPYLPPSAEVHVLGELPGEVSGPVEVFLFSYLREDERFPHAHALTQAIERDRQRATALLSREPVPPRLLR